MIRKGDCGFDPPGTVFGGVENLSGIVGVQSGPQIFGEADIEGLRGNFALQDIDVVEFHSFAFSWLAES